MSKRLFRVRFRFRHTYVQDAIVYVIARDIQDALDFYAKQTHIGASTHVFSVEEVYDRLPDITPLAADIWKEEREEKKR